MTWTCYPDIYPNYKLGESSIHDFYCQMIDSAKSSVYIESQHPGEAKILSLLYKKLKENKNFKVIYIAPIHMMYPIRKCKQEAIDYQNKILNSKQNTQFGKIMKSLTNNNNNNQNEEKPRYFDTFDTLSRLGKDFSNLESSQANSSQFMLCGLSKYVEYIEFESIYVHSKLCIIDGMWFTLGSANMVDISFLKDHSEINACIWNEKESMMLLKRLANKHIGNPYLLKDSSKWNSNDKKVNGFFGLNEKTGKEYNDNQIVSKLIDIATRNRIYRLENDKVDEKSIIGNLVALDSSLYATNEMEIDA